MSVEVCIGSDCKRIMRRKRKWKTEKTVKIRKVKQRQWWFGSVKICPLKHTLKLIIGERQIKQEKKGGRENI